MRRSLPALLAALLLTGCGRLATLLYSPPQTPTSWLVIQPYIEFQLGPRTLLLVQPSTSALVYLLGLLAIAAGLVFLRLRSGQTTRLWWGVALLLWGAGALLAGTSYEAFSYQIKCAGREACLWTSGWEIGYLLLSVASLDAMLLAEACSSASGVWRVRLSRYALLNFVFYLVTLLVGVFVPVRFLVSFEWLLLVSAPNVIIFLVLNGVRYARRRAAQDLMLLVAWVWLVLTIAAYFLYLLSGLTQRLWAQGRWFSENDLLHIGLIVWMAYLALVVAPRVEDEAEVAEAVSDRATE